MKGIDGLLAYPLYPKTAMQHIAKRTPIVPRIRSSIHQPFCHISASKLSAMRRKIPFTIAYPSPHFRRYDFERVSYFPKRYRVLFAGTLFGFLGAIVEHNQKGKKSASTSPKATISAFSGDDLNNKAFSTTLVTNRSDRLSQLLLGAFHVLVRVLLELTETPPRFWFSLLTEPSGTRRSGICVCAAT